VALAYTALATIGWIGFCAILFSVAWVIFNWRSFVDFVAQLFDDEDGEIADAWGDVVWIPQEMRPARKMAEGGRSEQRGRADTHTTTEHKNTSLRTGTGAL
jgi:hypothetical protein